MSDETDWTAKHYPAPCGCGQAMDLNAVSHGCERWRCEACRLYFIRETPKMGHSDPDWSAGVSFAVHVANMKRIVPLPTVSTAICPRCSATIDPATVERHHERCFVVGDAVRVAMPNSRWIEGPITTLSDHNGHVAMRPERSSDDRLRCYIETGCFSFRLTDKVSHIQRPGQALVTGCAFVHGESDRIEAVPVGAYRTPHVLSIKVTTPEPNCTINGVPAYCPPPQAGPRPIGLCSNRFDGTATFVGPKILLCEKPTGHDGDHRCGSYGWGSSVQLAERENERRRRIAVVAEQLYDGKITGEQARELLASPDLEPPAPTLYDGLPFETCLRRWTSNRHQVENGALLLFDLTPAQAAVAKAAYLDSVSSSWSHILRARISAAKERERLTVCMPVDAEDLPW